MSSDRWVPSWVMHVPVVSSSHIRRSDAAILDTHPEDVAGFLATVLAIGGSNFGWIMEAEDAEWNAGLPGCENNSMETWMVTGLSQEFCNLMIWAQQSGYSYLRIDPDGCVIPGMPVFDW